MTIWTREPGRDTFRAGSLISRPTLDTMLSFDAYPVRILPDGRVDDGDDGLSSESFGYSPESLPVDDGELTSTARAAGWEPITGFTGQHGYRGPVMHPSECIGGGLAEHILTNPGVYAVAVVQDSDDEEPSGWAILRKVEPASE